MVSWAMARRIRLSTPVTVSGISTATAIALGNRHSCAVLSSGAVRCWGDNFYGELGDGTTTDAATPVTVSGISTATTIALGNRHSCALLDTVRCNAGEPATTVNSATPGHSGAGPVLPVTVSGISTATALALGDWHSCAVLASGAVKCWGNNAYGQLGNYGLWGWACA